jgi:uncharacterized protein with von Willebrand factor type A (vWA) domain
MSKGSRQRPVDKDKFDAEFDRIFGKKNSNQNKTEDKKNVGDKDKKGNGSS